jgi:hypothetical protein
MMQSQPSLSQKLTKFESGPGMTGGSNNTRESRDQEVGGLCLMYMEAGLQGHTRASIVFHTMLRSKWQGRKAQGRRVCVEILYLAASSSAILCGRSCLRS